MPAEEKSSDSTNDDTNIKGATVKKILVFMSLLLLLAAISLAISKKYTYAAGAAGALLFFIGATVALHKYIKRQENAVQEGRHGEAVAVTRDAPAARPR